MPPSISDETRRKIRKKLFTKALEDWMSEPLDPENRRKRREIWQKSEDRVYIEDRCIMPDDRAMDTISKRKREILAKEWILWKSCLRGIG